MHGRVIIIGTGLLLGVAVIFLTGAAQTQNGSEIKTLIWTDAHITVTVGPDQDFETLEEALDWSSKRVFINGGGLTISLAPGEHILENYEYRNMNARSVFIVGPVLKGKMPLVEEMTGQKAEDIELVRTKFGAWIEIRGNKLHGLALPYGLGGIKNVATINPDTFGDGPTRYTISCGLQSSWETSEVGASIHLGKVAVVGGVWGINAVGCRVVNTSDLFFAYHFNAQPTGALAYADSGAEIILGVAASNPRTHSSTRMVADNGGRIYAQGSTGVTYEPTNSGQMNGEGSLLVQ